jgi:hypothetical protein
MALKKLAPVTSVLTMAVLDDKAYRKKVFCKANAEIASAAHNVLCVTENNNVLRHLASQL